MAKREDGKTKSYYYEIVPLKAGGGNKSVFTYSHTEKISPSTIVQITFRSKKLLGLVMKTVARPSFKTLPIVSVTTYRLPNHLRDLASWISEYYVSPLGSVFQNMIPRNLSTKNHKSTIEMPPKTSSTQVAKISISLNSSQKQVLKSVKDSEYRTYLLHGVTGSGKTQVYIELIKKALLERKSSIILVPEIALTPQLMYFFSSQIDTRVLLTHSGLTQAERKSLWQEAYASDEPLVILGPRSALFMPVKKLGYVIIDESHEHTYKQDQSPRYHASAVAAKLAHLSNAKLLLGTATPTTSDWYMAEKDRIKLLELKEPIFTSKKHIELVDMRDKQHFRASQFISTSLKKHLAETLGRKKQSIIFLNRRGSANVLLCRDCGWSAKCPDCQIPLTFHADKGKLICHWCNNDMQPPATCPTEKGGCGGLELRFIGAGTKRIESELAKMFPEARIERLDRDSFDPKKIDDIYKKLRTGKIDILIGTQMIAKGLDIQNIETIGIVMADSLLNIPDFSASERTFQLIHQVAGRAGRSEGADAKVIIQTYSPNHATIQAALDNSYYNFISQELKERKALRYPPYVYLLKLSVAKKSQSTVENTANKLANKLKKQFYKNGSLVILGPAPSFREQYSGNYHWQIVIKAKNRDDLLSIANDLPTGWTHDLDPVDLL